MSPEQEDAIVRMYQVGMSIREIAKKVGCSTSPVKRVLHASSVAVRGPKQKLPVRSDAFAEISAPEQAYWLGFLFADGCNSEDTGVISLSLSTKDRDHLEKFKRFLESDHKVGTTKRKNRPRCEEVSLRIMDRQLSSDLAKWGCYQRKTFSLKFPTGVPVELQMHFLRGYFDGDGCISIHHRVDKRNPKWQWTEIAARVVGTKEFLLTFQRILSSIGIESKVSPEKSVFMLRVGKKAHVKHFLSYLYNEEGPRLERKWLVAQKILQGEKS